MMLKIGTREWWRKEFLRGSHGIIHAIMKLVAERNITAKKGLQLVEAAIHRNRKTSEIPPAPWEDVRW